jgi:uncharacterized membrane protein
MPTNRRLESFSDAVFAIAITIMVLEIHIPATLAFSDDPKAFSDFATIFATYVLSFIIIANLWVSHHYLLYTVSRPTRATIWFNNLLLLGVTLIPVTTRFLGLHPHSPRAVAAYGVVAFACTAAFMLLRSHASKHTHNAVFRDIHRRVLRRATLFLVFYGASIPLAFINTWLSWICFLIVPPMLFLPIIQASRAPSEEHDEHHGLERSCP